MTRCERTHDCYTTVWIDYVRGISAPLTNLLGYELDCTRIITGDRIITEFLQGFHNAKDHPAAKAIMESLEYRDFAAKKIALQSAQNFRILQRNGIAVCKTIDVIIATFCIENGFELLHNDLDFDPMEELPGLTVRKYRARQKTVYI